MIDSSTQRSPHERQLDLLIAEYEEAAGQGRPPNREEFLRQHPEFSAELQDYFADVDQLEKLVLPRRPNLEETQPASGSIPTSLKPGTVVRYFGDYEMLEELGAGGMGVVYKARQTKLKRIVALKMIKVGHLASEADVRRFQVEARAAANLDHANIVAVHEVGVHQGQHYYTMDFVGGGSLSHLNRDEPVAARKAAELVKQLAEAMHYAHGQGIVHRDLKPANVLLTTVGSPRITDFGLAKRLWSADESVGASMTETGQVLGTAGYMSPEQASGRTRFVGPPADIYALGAVLYALLTSRAPFVGESQADTILQVIQKEPVSPRVLNPSVPRDLETICIKCLEKEPHKRYGTAQLLADDLSRFIEGRPVVARPIHRPARAWRWCRRNPWIAGLAGTVAASLLIGTIVSSTLAVVAYHNQKESEIKGAALADALDAKQRQYDEIARLTKDRTVALDEARWQVYRLRMMRMEQLWNEKDWGHLERLLKESVPASGERDLRGWEWHYLKGQTERRAWAIHEEPQKAVAFDWERSNGKLAVFRAGAVDIWLPQERRLEKTIEISAAPAGNGIVRWSPDRRRVAVFGGGLKVHVIDTVTSQIDCTMSDPGLSPDNQYVSNIEWSPRGDCVAVSISHRRIQLWKVAREPVPIKLLEAQHGVAPANIHWSSDQATCVTTSRDGWAMYWNTANWTLLRKKQLVNNWCHDVSWSPDGSHVAFASAAVYLANADGAETKKLRDQGATISALCWLDNRRLLTANEAQEIRIVHLDQQTPDEVFKLHSQRVSGVSSGPTGQIASIAQGESLKLWFPGEIAAEYTSLPGARVAPPASTCVWHPRSNVVGLVVEQQGRNMAATWETGATDVGSVPLSGGAKGVRWEESGDGLVMEMEGGNWKSVPWPTPQGTSPATTSRRLGPSYSYDGRFRIDAEVYSARVEIVDTYGTLETIYPNVSSLYAYAWHPSQQVLAIARHNEIRLCKPGQPPATWRTSSNSDLIDMTFCLAWSPDGQYLLAGGRSGAIHMLNGATLEVVHVLRGQAGSVTAAAWSKDGTRIVSAGFDDFLRFWDSAKGVEIFKMPLAKSDHLLELNISADGRWLAGRSHAGKVSVWTIDAERPSPQSSPATPHRPDAEETLESLSEQIASDPGNARAWLLRARLNYRWQRWEPAANDFEQYIRLNPMDLWGLQDLALTSLAAGRNEPYLRHCREIEARLSARATADIHHTRGARLLSLREGGFEDGDKLLAAASKMAENSRDWPLVHPQVPLLYRLKRFDEALREARRIDVARLGGKPRAPLHAWEAMILWRLDRRQEARQALALAKKHISSIKQLKGTSAGYSDCVVEAEIALREAETLVTAED